MIDKPYPFSSPNPALAGYVARYNAEYARTPALLGRLDSLLAAVADEPARLADAGMGAQMLFWSNGHPNGAYVAREISETFGVGLPARRGARSGRVPAHLRVRRAEPRQAVAVLAQGLERDRRAGRALLEAERGRCEAVTEGPYVASLIALRPGAAQPPRIACAGSAARARRAGTTQASAVVARIVPSTVR